MVHHRNRRFSRNQCQSLQLVTRPRHFGQMAPPSRKTDHSLRDAGTATERDFAVTLSLKADVHSDAICGRSKRLHTERTCKVSSTLAMLMERSNPPWARPGASELSALEVNEDFENVHDVKPALILLDRCLSILGDPTRRKLCRVVELTDVAGSVLQSKKTVNENCRSATSSKVACFPSSTTQPS